MGKWKKSLINNLYWSAVTTPNGDGNLIQAKWLSVDNHIHNIHNKHGTLFPACKHKTIEEGKRNGLFQVRAAYNE